MFDIGFWELLAIGIIGLLVIGPERLPAVARTLGHWAGRLRSFVTSVKSDIDREMRTDELRRIMDAQRTELDALKRTMSETREEVDAVTRPDYVVRAMDDDGPASRSDGDDEHLTTGETTDDDDRDDGTHDRTR